METFTLNCVCVHCVFLWLCLCYVSSLLASEGLLTLVLSNPSHCELLEW